MAKLNSIQEIESTPLFSKDDIKWFRRSLEKFVQERDTYGKSLSIYEIFLISVAAVNWYPAKNKITVASYHDNDIENYLQKYVLENHPTIGERFCELSRPMITDENKRKHRWIRDRFVPRAFWDQIYQESIK